VPGHTSAAPPCSAGDELTALDDEPAERAPPRERIWVSDLHALWEVDVPEAPELATFRREDKLRRAETTASAFDRLEALGPVIVEARVADDLLIGKSLILAPRTRAGAGRAVRGQGVDAGRAVIGMDGAQGHRLAARFGDGINTFGQGVARAAGARRGVGHPGDDILASGRMCLPYS
jgi:hypothetical protein